MNIINSNTVQNFPFCKSNQVLQSGRNVLLKEDYEINNKIAPPEEQKRIYNQMFLNSYIMSKYNLSFKSKICIEEISDDEFEKEVDDLTFDSDIDPIFLNKNNIQIAKKLKKINQQHNLSEIFDINLLLLLSQSKDFACSINHILDNNKIDKVLTNNKIMDLISNLADNEQEETAIKILNKCSELINDKKYENNTDLLITIVCKELMNNNDCIKYMTWITEKISLDFLHLCQVQSTNEISREGKKQFLEELIASENGKFDIADEIKTIFPIIPTKKEDYCKLLPDIVNSMKINTPVLLEKDFDKTLINLGEILYNISDEEFKNITITQQYSKDKFISDVLEKTKGLPKLEVQKIYNYFGFEIYQNDKSEIGYSISGYPMNNTKALSEINNNETISVIEKLRENIINYTKNNQITCNNKSLEHSINNLMKILPELRTSIGCKQHGETIIPDNGSKIQIGHQFDIFKHSLKVMQCIVKNPQYQKLNNSDKKIMLLASLFHDIAKKEGEKDYNHAVNSSLDAYFITKKFNLNEEEKIKLYTLIKNHEWNSSINSALNEAELKRMQKSAAYELRYENIFYMALIFAHADLKGVNDYFHDEKSYTGMSYGEFTDFHAKKIKEYINELKESQPLLPITQIPSAKTIESAITKVNTDGSTNIQGVYKDKDGLIILQYNKLRNEDLEEIGFPKGSLISGIKAKTSSGEDVNTGNIKFFVHGLDYNHQLAKFNAFSLINSEVLLSVSYAERPESKYTFFKEQGVILDCDTAFIHGGNDSDVCSGSNKFVKDFKEHFILGEKIEESRTFLSDLIKKTLKMGNDDYIEFVKNNKNKSLQEIEPKEYREKLIQAFCKIKSSEIEETKDYNEIYISNPKPPMAVFAYAKNYDEKVLNPVKFLNRTQKIGNETKSVRERTEFLREYAIKNNIPFVVFGD